MLGWERGERSRQVGEYSPAGPAALLYTLQEQHGEYIAGVAYRGRPIGHGELGWAGPDALGKWCIPASHPASPYLQKSSWEASLRLNARAQHGLDTCPLLGFVGCGLVCCSPPQKKKCMFSAGQTNNWIPG